MHVGSSRGDAWAVRHFTSEASTDADSESESNPWYRLRREFFCDMQVASRLERAIGYANFWSRARGVRLRVALLIQLANMICDASDTSSPSMME